MNSSDGTALVLRRRLKQIGLSDPAIAAAWPTWWSEAAEASASAGAELRFSLARKLGLDPRSLLDDLDTPRFVWRDEARFKHLSAEDEQELAAITSFGKALTASLLAATRSEVQPGLPSAQDLRRMLLRGRTFIGLRDLLTVAWSLEIPVVHLRVFPSDRKRMAAMVVQAGTRNAILLGKDSDYPAQVAFYLAHELGHIALGHLKSGQVLVDMDDEGTIGTKDDEENEADRYALELLTGRPSPQVLPWAKRYTAPQLARDALKAGPAHGIEPGTLALCFGYSTGDWRRTMAAMRGIYADPKPVWREVNRIAWQQLVLEEISDDTVSYIAAVLGNSKPR